MRVLFVGVFIVCFGFVSCYAGIDTKGYRGAFVIPQVIKDKKTYVLVGRESGGRDKGLYCFPGGSSGFWFFRDTDPIKTATREFCEETLTALDSKAVRSLVEQHNQTAMVTAHGKKVIAYSTLFPEQEIDDIIHHFEARRAKTWFWQYYYREMDHFALIEWDAVMSAVKNTASEGKNCTVEGLVFNAQTKVYEKRMIGLRPIAVLLSKEYQKDNKKS